MQPLLRGTLAPRGYAVLLRNLHEIYVALEQGLTTHQNSPVLMPLNHASLRRAPRIALDLDALEGRHWPGLPVAPTTDAYARRLRALADTAPALLLAHAYVRYLGDLSGGQQIAKIVRRVLPADKAAATAFYEFPEIADATAFKHEVRASLDALHLSNEQTAAVVAEARWGFQSHATLFDELVPLAGNA